MILFAALLVLFLAQNSSAGLIGLSEGKRGSGSSTNSGVGLGNLDSSKFSIHLIPMPPEFNQAATSLYKIERPDKNLPEPFTCGATTYVIDGVERLFLYCESNWPSQINSLHINEAKKKGELVVTIAKPE